MIPGFNCERPKKEDYERFVDRLARGIEPLSDGLMFMLYGSYARGDYVPGRSDIDGMLITPHDVTIDKNYLHEVSRIFAEALRGTNVQAQITLSDLATMKDGRFNTYDPSFISYFKEEGKVVAGPDYRGVFRYELPDTPGMYDIRFNLRKSRNALLFSEFDRTEDYEAFIRKFGKTLDAVSTAAKRIIYVSEGQVLVYKNRFSTLGKIKAMFPEVDTKPLEEIRDLYKDTHKLDELYRKPEELIGYLDRSVSFLEELIKAYMRKTSRLEEKGLTSLPVITDETVKSFLAELERGKIEKTMIDIIDRIAKENPKIAGIIATCSRGDTNSALGGCSVYEVLRRQLDADNLKMKLK